MQQCDYSSTGQDAGDLRCDRPGENTVISVIIGTLRSKQLTSHSGELRKSQPSDRRPKKLRCLDMRCGQLMFGTKLRVSALSAWVDVCFLPTNSNDEACLAPASY